MKTSLKHSAHRYYITNSNSFIIVFKGRYIVNDYLTMCSYDRDIITKREEKERIENNFWISYTKKEYYKKLKEYRKDHKK